MNEAGENEEAHEILIARPQGRVAFADRFGEERGVWCCEKREQCRFQGFVLKAGLAWGVVPVGTIWRKRHDKVCGGRLIQIVERVK